MASAVATANGDTLVESSKHFDRELLSELPESIDVSSLGEGLKLVSRRTVELDHEFATSLLSMREFNADRPLNNNHVLHLKATMERGTFLPEQVTVVTCSLNGAEYRMNGQHTSWARLEMPEKYRCPIQHLRYRAESEDDMRRLYASIDRMKSRSTGNVVCSYLYGTPEWSGFSKGTLTKLAEAMSFWLWESGHQRSLRDGDHRCYLLNTEYHSLGKRVASFAEQCTGLTGKHIRRSPVIAAMFATFNKAQQQASEFWSAVRDGTGFVSKGDPRLVLRNNLLSASIGIGRGATPDKKSVDPEEMYRWCIHAWNSWRHGEQLKLLKSTLGADRPKAL